MHERPPILQYQAVAEPIRLPVAPGSDTTGTTLAGSNEQMFQPRLPARAWHPSRDPIEQRHGLWLTNPGPDASGGTFAGSGEAMFQPRLPRYWRDCQEPIMGWYDPASLTLSNAPEPIHPENYPAMTLLPLPSPRRLYQGPLMDDACHESSTLAEAPHPAAMQPLGAPSGAPPRRQQPPMERLDPAELDLSGLPISVGWQTAPNQPLRIPRTRFYQDRIESRPFFFDHAAEISSVWPPLDRVTLPARGVNHLLATGEPETIGDVSSSYAPPEPMSRPSATPPRSRLQRLESAVYSPDGFADQATVDLGWWTPLAAPVRPAATRSRAVGTPGEHDPSQLGSTAPAGFVDAALSQPPRGVVRVLAARGELVVDPATLAEPEGWTEPLAAPLPPARQRIVPPLSTAPEFTDVSAADWGELAPLAAPVWQRGARELPPLAGVEFTLAWTPPTPIPTITYDDRSIPRDAPGRNPNAPGGVMQSIPPVFDVLAGMGNRPFRAASPMPSQPAAVVQVDVGAQAGTPDQMSQPRRTPPGRPLPPIGEPPLSPTVFQVLAGGGLDAMGTPLPTRRAAVAPPALADVLVVAQQNFAAPDQSAYHTDWLVMRRPAPPTALRLPMEAISTTAFYGATGNPPPFTGVGQIIVTASDIWVFGATATELDVSQRGGRSP